MDIKISMRNSFQEENFMKMLAWMEWCGNIGHSTSFRVIFDGDGTAKIRCDFETEEMQEKYNAIKEEVRHKYNNNGYEFKYFEFGV